MITGYVVKNIDTGKYVTPPGSNKAYTKFLQFARIYGSYDRAKSDCCGNEIVIPIENELNQLGEE